MQYASHTMVKQMHPKLIKKGGDTHLGFHWIQIDVHDSKTQNDFRINFYPFAFIMTHVSNERFLIGIGILRFNINLELNWYG